MKRTGIVVLFVFVLAAAGLAFGQLTPTGKITGKVIDNQGGALPGVAIDATNPKLVGKASTVTDANGIYRLMALPSGTL